MYLKEYAPIKVIARTLGRSTESVEQKVRLLGLKRDNSLAVMVRYRGLGILKYGKTSKEVLANLRAKSKADLQRRKAKQQQEREHALKLYAANVKMLGKEAAATMAHEHGATLRALAELMGCSGQGVLNVVRRYKSRHHKGPAKARRR